MSGDGYDDQPVSGRPVDSCICSGVRGMYDLPQTGHSRVSVKLLGASSQSAGVTDAVAAAPHFSQGIFLVGGVRMVRSLAAAVRLVNAAGATDVAEAGPQQVGVLAIFNQEYFGIIKPRAGAHARHSFCHRTIDHSVLDVARRECGRAPCSGADLGVG